MSKGSETPQNLDIHPEDPQGIELEDVSSPRDTTVASPHLSSDVTMQLENGSSQQPWDLLQTLSKLPAINVASMRFAQTASSFGRGLSSLLDEAGKLELNSGQHETGSKSSTSACSSSPNVDQTFASSPSTSSFDLFKEQIPAIEKVTSMLSSSGTAMTELGQRFLRSSPNVWQGVVARIQTTWRGSADDIGWLKQMPGLASVEDQTNRFGQILGLVCNGVHQLPDNLVYLLVPGLFSNYGPLYFIDTQKYFQKLGLTCHIAKIHSEAAVETNASELKNYIEELYWGSGKQIALLGHSKGGVDVAAAVAVNWSSLKGKVAGLVLVQSPYGGSPIASDILREGQIADVQARHLIELLMHKLLKGDIRSLEDLTYDKRQKFLAKYPLPSDFPVVSFHTEVNIAPNILSEMSHIAHAEFPWLVSSPGIASEQPTVARLPVIIPLPAVMAICAKHIELRYGHKSDGLVIRQDAEVPGSVVVRPDRKLDHAWMVYSPARKAGNEPDSAQMCESLLTLLFEVCQREYQIRPDNRADTNNSGDLSQ